MNNIELEFSCRALEYWLSLKTHTRIINLCKVSNYLEQHKKMVFSPGEGGGGGGNLDQFSLAGNQASPAHVIGPYQWDYLPLTKFPTIVSD